MKVISISTPCDACMGTGSVKAHVACSACAGTGRLTHTRGSVPATDPGPSPSPSVNAHHGYCFSNVRSLRSSDQNDDPPVRHRPKRRRPKKSTTRFLTLADLEAGLGDAPGQKR